MKSIQQNAKKIKPDYRLDLLEEKRAYVVIALTDKLSATGKLVAMNALAHYHSEKGFSYPSQSTIAVECGLSDQSTKTIRSGQEEIARIGAFKIIKHPPKKGSKKSDSHHCCPNMQWFRDEYQRLRSSGRVDDDGFENMREQNRKGSQPDQIGLSTSSNGVHDPIKQGSKPYKENRANRTKEREQGEAHISSLVVDSIPSKASNDNQPANDPKITKRRAIANDAFDRYPKRRESERDRFVEVFLQLAEAGKITSKEQVSKAMERYLDDTEAKYVARPERFLAEHLEVYSRPKKPKFACAI